MENYLWEKFSIGIHTKRNPFMERTSKKIRLHRKAVKRPEPSVPTVKLSGHLIKVK